MFRIKRRSKENVITFGIVGVNKGVGVTHLALAIANYLCSKEGYEVIYVELSDSSCLYDVVSGKTSYVNQTIAYEYKEVNYVLTNSIDEVKEILLLSKCPVVVDFEKLDKVSTDVFNLCKHKIVVGSIKPWCRKQYERFIEEKIKGKIDIKQIEFCGRQINNKEKADFYKNMHFEIFNIPEIVNPFKILEKEFELIEKIIW